MLPRNLLQHNELFFYNRHNSSNRLLLCWQPDGSALVAGPCLPKKD